VRTKTTAAHENYGPRKHQLDSENNQHHGKKQKSERSGGIKKRRQITFVEEQRNKTKEGKVNNRRGTCNKGGTSGLRPRGGQQITYAPIEKPDIAGYDSGRHPKTDLEPLIQRCQKN